MFLIFKLVRFFIYKELKEIFFFFYYLKNKKKLFKKKNRYNLFNKYLDKKNLDKNILITTFLYYDDYLKYEHLLGIYLSKVTKSKIFILLEQNDKKSRNYFENVGLDNFIFYKKNNIFYKIKNLILSYKIISKIKNFEDFINFDYKGLPAGKLIYGHHTRYTGIPTTDFIRVDYYYFLSEFIDYYDQFNEIIDKYKIDLIVQSEHQFIPMTVLYGIALKKKLTVFLKIGTTDISVKKGYGLDNIFENRYQYDTEIIKKLSIEKKKEDLKKIGNNYIEERFLDKNKAILDVDSERIKLLKKEKKKMVSDYKKSDICNLFNWDEKKPIGAIFSNDLTDGLFATKTRLFLDNYLWLRTTIEEASKNKDINWIIKPHPNEIKNDVKLTTKDLVQKMKLPNHIRLLPIDYAAKSLPKIISVLFTSHGSAGYEYVAVGIPVVTAAEALYSNLNISIEAKSKKEYFEIIKNSHKIDKPNEKSIENAKLFAYVFTQLTRISFPIVTDDFQFQSCYSELYWKEFEKVFNIFDKENKGKLENDIFYKSLLYQITNNNKHTLNIKELGKLDQNY